MSNPSTPASFEAWVKTAQRGESIVYAYGTIMVPPSRDMLRVAMSACDGGLVNLVQRREPGGTFSYIAQRSAKQKQEKPEKKPVACRTPGCNRYAPPGGKTGHCRQCNVNIARKRRRGCTA